MAKTSACFEITSRTVRLAVGYPLNDDVIVIYKREEPIDGLVSNGRIVDKATLASVLKKFARIQDEDNKISLTLTECALVLPPLGFNVYESSKTTKIIAHDNKIARVDINNVMSLIIKADIPDGSKIVDCIPDEYVLDNGKRFVDPPLGETADSLTLNCKVHTLNSDVLHEYLSVFNDAGIRVIRQCMAPYCETELFKGRSDLPHTYLLVDMGASITSITLVGNDCPFGNTYFFEAGDSITERIASNFGIAKSEAEKLKKTKGYFGRDISYDPVVVSGHDQYGADKQYTQKDLDKAIVDSVSLFAANLKNAIQSMLKAYGGKLDNVPIVIVGGGCRMKGFLDLLRPLIPNREIHYGSIKSVGCREPSFASTLGLIKVTNDFKGSLGDTAHGVRQVSRENSGKQNRKKDDPKEDVL